MTRQLAKDLIHIPVMPRNSINAYIVEGMLIDSGIKASFNIIQKAISQTPIHLHILTHAHADHQGCSNRICNEYQIPLYCHEKEVARAQSGLATADYPDSKGWIARLQQRYWAGAGYGVSKTIKENDLIGNFRVIETPGHAAGHISLFREWDGTLIIGDAATNMHLLTTVTGLRLPPAIFTSNQAENIRSLQKLANLKPRLLCFGHGPVLHNNRRQFETFVETQSRKFSADV